MDVVPYAGVTSAYVDNPFFDPLDPATSASLGLESTRGDSAQFDLDAGLRAVLPISGIGRAEFSGFGRYSIWRGAAETSGWDAGAMAGLHHPLTERLELRVEALGAAAAIAAFPDDDLWWGEARLGGRWVVDAAGRHRLDARIGYGYRAVPDRLVDAQTGATGQRDHLLRARVGWRSTVAGLALEPSYAIDLTRPSVGGLESDTHALALRITRPIALFDAAVDLAGWLRDFPGDAVSEARQDLGFAVGARLGHQPWQGVEVAGRYRYLRSGSDDPLGDYAQHFAGVELSAWYAPRRAPVAQTRAEGAPLSTPAGWLFRVRDPSAKTVALVGDFNDWSPTVNLLQGPDADGWWSVIVDLPAGRYTYMFVLDGDRFVRPADAPRYVDDGFGGEVGVIYVMPSDPPEEARANR